MMIFYELKKSYTEILWKNREQIEEGCSIQRDSDPEKVESFENLNEALCALEQKKTSVEYYTSNIPYYSITEYFVEQNSYEDGDWYDGGNIHGISPMKIFVKEKDGLKEKTINTFNNFYEAENAVRKLDLNLSVDDYREFFVSFNE